MPDLAQKIKMLPDSPGVYQMKNKGEIIYVGKAKNLKNRVRSYFQFSADHTMKVRAMVDKVDDFEIILCDTELEALILENTLIKRHQPWYNILLKDDKAYPYIRVTQEEPYPRMLLARKIEEPESKYFGPYQGATLVREVMEVARKVYPLRICKQPLPRKTPGRPCIQFETGKCIAPCRGDIAPEQYASKVKELLAFLSGGREKLIGLLEEEMKSAAKNLKFERAALIRDQISAVRALEEKQKVVSVQQSDVDVIAAAREKESAGDAMVEVLFIRDGKLIGAEHYLLERAADEPEETLLQEFILQFYDEAAFLPPNIMLATPPADADVLFELLSQKKGARVRMSVPQRGDKRKMLDMAEKNAGDALIKHVTDKERVERRTSGAMRELRDALGLCALPRRIEGYDISNTQGSLSVAAMVVCEDGAPKPSDYRHFRIKTVEGADDFRSIHEVVSRRFRHLAEGDARFGAKPDLVLIDGGPQQLKMALEAMRSQGFDIPMFGLAEKYEEIYVENRETPIVLDRHSDALHMIQRVRDEAHRFGITHHRNLRGKESVKSKLEIIEGVGPRRRAALLSKFRTMARVSQATLEELSAVEGVDKRTAETVYAHFHPDYAPTLSSAVVFSVTGRLEEWVHAFLTGEGGNVPFSEGLRLAPRAYSGPVEIPVKKLTRCCGPEESMRFRVDEASFEKRIAMITARIQAGGWDMPPLIVYRGEDGALTLNDGNHRFEAMKRLGAKKCRAILWETKTQEP